MLAQGTAIELTLPGAEVGACAGHSFKAAPSVNQQPLEVQHLPCNCDFLCILQPPPSPTAPARLQAPIRAKVLSCSSTMISVRLQEMDSKVGTRHGHCRILCFS